MTRRQAFVAALTPFLSPSASPATPPGKMRLGGAPTSFTNRWSSASGQRPVRDSLAVVEHCHRLGLAGAETYAPPADPAAVKTFRQKVEQYNLQVIMNPPLPRTADDVAQFDSAVRACKDCGAVALHAAMTGRRYEQFDNFPAFKTFFEQCQKSVALAEPILRKHQIRLAIENHKGWRSAEQAAWLNRVGSEWVGVCLDFGNNLALCELPADTLRILAPFTIFAHIKDMGVQNDEDGFLLSEVPFGQGVVNLQQTVQTLRQRDPNMLFCLEMITRDPLRIPVFTDRYWATFDESSSPLPGRDLAKTLDLVRKNPPKTPLPRTAGLSKEAQVKLEDQLNQQCIDYARQHLGA